jgi:ABC-type glycerol-3-phosphate transport system substrate-binding protein
MVRRLVAGGVITITLLLLSACTPAAPKRAAQPPSAPQSTVETIKVMSTPGLLLDALLDPVIAEFQQQYPQYRVEKVPAGQGSQFPTRAEMVSTMQDGTLDVVEITWWEDALTRASLPLDSYIKKTGFDLKPYGSSLEQYLVNGRYYYLPVAILAGGLMVNLDMASAAGAKLPTASWTWDEFRATAKAIAHDEEGRRIYALPDLPVEALAVHYVESKTERPAWTASDAELKDALNYFQALIKLDRTLQPPAVRTYDGPLVGEQTNEQTWLAGQAAFAPGIYGYTDQLRVGFKVTFVPMPTHPGHPPAAPAAPYCMAISGGTKHPDAAWAFLSFTAGRQGAAILASAGTLPLYAGEGVREAWFAQKPTPPAYTEVFFQTRWLVNAEAWTHQRTADSLIAFERLVNRVLAQSFDVDEALVLYHQELGRIQGGK